MTILTRLAHESAARTSRRGGRPVRRHTGPLPVVAVLLAGSYASGTMRPLPRLLGLLSVVVSTAWVPGSVWAHGAVDGAGVGWGDELALLLTPVVLGVALLGWMTLDGRRRPSKPRPGGRGRAA